MKSSKSFLLIFLSFFGITLGNPFKFPKIGQSQYKPLAIPKYGAFCAKSNPKPYIPTLQLYHRPPLYPQRPLLYPPMKQCQKCEDPPTYEWPHAPVHEGELHSPKFNPLNKPKFIPEYSPKLPEPAPLPKYVNTVAPRPDCKKPKPKPKEDCKKKVPIKIHKEPEPVYKEEPEPVYEEEPEPVYAEEPETVYEEPKPKPKEDCKKKVPIKIHKEPEPIYKEEPEPVYEEEPEPVYKEDPEPIYEDPKPVYEKPKPVCEKPKPVYEKPKSLYKEPEPVYEKEPEPVYEEEPEPLEMDYEEEPEVTYKAEPAPSPPPPPPPPPPPSPAYDIPCKNQFELGCGPIVQYVYCDSGYDEPKKRNSCTKY